MKVIKAIFKVLLCLVLLVGLTIGGLNIWIRTASASFYKNSEKEFQIPGLSEGFVPKGITYDENSGYYLVSGSMSDNSASRIYTIDPATSDFTYVELKTTGGEADTPSAAGIAVHGRYVFLSTGTELINVYRLAEVTDSDLSSATPFATFTAANRPETLFIHNDYIFMGEYYNKEGYDTPGSHKFESDNGEQLNAVMLMYDITSLVQALSESEQAALQPEAAYAVPDNCTGMCVLKSGQLCLSSAKGMKSSTLRIYDDPMKTNLTSDNTYSALNGEKVPLYYVDSDSMLKEISVPPMAQELVTQGDKILVLTSAASNKSMFGKLTGAGTCRSFIPEF